MNLPSSNAFQLLKFCQSSSLKAWELLNDGGHLVALINSETINNLCTKERELLSIIIADFGASEDLGQCFKQAERPTNVAISMVRLQKPPKESVINFDTINVEHDSGVSAEEFSANPLAHRNVIKNLVARYNAVQSILVARKEQQSKLDFYLDGISRIVYDSCDREQADSLVNSVTLNDQIGAIKSRFWNTVFQKTKIGQKVTTDFVRKFSDFSRTQAAMAFTEENIIEVLSMFYLNRQEIMQECIVTVFDTATAYHEKNKVWIEGWKTNKSYRVNKRIIIPWGVSYDQRWGFSVKFGQCQDFLSDLDKVLCWLSGINSDSDTFRCTYQTLDHFCGRTRQGADYQSTVESTFFKIRIFKKGTLHLDFRDLALLATFNKAASIGKKWIGGGY